MLYSMAFMTSCTYIMQVHEPGVSVQADAAFAVGSALCPTAELQDAVFKGFMTSLHRIMQVHDGSVRADAAVAAGNALCSAAELRDASSAALLLAAACGAYEAALATEDDAMTHSNLADALVREKTHTQTCLLFICVFLNVWGL